MRTESDRWLGALFHGWVEILTLFTLLLVAVALFTWAWNRGFRPADRGPLLSAPLLIAGTAMILLLRAFRDDLLPAIIIALGLVLAGLLGRSVQPRGLWMPVMAFSALLGLERNLSALVLGMVVLLALLFSARQQR
ncbi:MAG TPA: hypothetical protein PKY96_04295 [Flavobacteriales bacterium]|nr:hypothetical protein [Flavobacteriales bacterium]